MIMSDGEWECSSRMIMSDGEWECSSRLGASLLGALHVAHAELGPPVHREGHSLCRLLTMIV